MTVADCKRRIHHAGVIADCAWVIMLVLFVATAWSGLDFVTFEPGASILFWSFAGATILSGGLKEVMEYVETDTNRKLDHLYNSS